LPRRLTRVERDALFERHLLDRDRASGSLLPAIPDLADLAACLPEGTLYVAPVLARDGLYILGVPRDGPARVVSGGGPASAVSDAISALRDELETQMRRYQQGRALSPGDRTRLDQCFDELGRGPLGSALSMLLDEHKPRCLLWEPDPALHGLPIHAVRLDGRYLIEQVEVVWTFAGALVVQQHATRHQRRGRWRPAVAVAEDPAMLPAAGREAEGVAAVFLRGQSRTGPSADRLCVRSCLARARIIHLACYAEFHADHPLGACLRLPSRESLHALEWLEEPVCGLALVTLSACRAAQVAALAGGEMLGCWSPCRRRWRRHSGRRWPGATAHRCSGRPSLCSETWKRCRTSLVRGAGFCAGDSAAMPADTISAGGTAARSVVVSGRAGPHPGRQGHRGPASVTWVPPRFTPPAPSQSLATPIRVPGRPVLRMSRVVVASHLRGSKRVPLVLAPEESLCALSKMIGLLRLLQVLRLL
jgi:hypothetical protein